MSGWSSARQGGWQRVRREETSLPPASGRWTSADVAALLITFYARWELGLAFLALKLWQQSSGYQGSVFAFAREKWDGLVFATRSVMSGASLPFAASFAQRGSGNHAFDMWRQSELARIEAERSKLRLAERDFANYRDGLLHGDRETFERFMQARGGTL